MVDWNQAPYWANVLLQNKVTHELVWAGSHMNNTLAVSAPCEGCPSFTLEKKSDWHLVETRKLPAFSQARKWAAQNGQKDTQNG